MVHTFAVFLHTFTFFLKNICFAILVQQMFFLLHRVSVRFFLCGFVGTAAFGIFRSLMLGKGEMWVQHKMMQYTDDLWELVKEILPAV